MVFPFSDKFIKFHISSPEGHTVGCEEFFVPIGTEKLVEDHLSTTRSVQISAD